MWGLKLLVWLYFVCVVVVIESKKESRILRESKVRERFELRQRGVEE